MLYLEGNGLEVSRALMDNNIDFVLEGHGVHG